MFPLYFVRANETGGLITTKTIEYFFGGHLWNRSISMYFHQRTIYTPMRLRFKLHQQNMFGLQKPVFYLENTNLTSKQIHAASRCAG